MNRMQCRGCAYFMCSSGHGGYRFCHYMLYTGKRRKVGEKEKCLSKSKKRRKVAIPCEVYAPQA